MIFVFDGKISSIFVFLFFKKKKRNAPFFSLQNGNFNLHFFPVCKSYANLVFFFFRIARVTSKGAGLGAFFCRSVGGT